ncbi:hypothetical protein [Microbacterium sp. KHB019]|uniref:hypothetical protein n=1 Tax=Microbacterium sp. KHB019 TaxID=3129770 RepID=UPI003079486C
MEYFGVSEASAHAKRSRPGAAARERILAVRLASKRALRRWSVFCPFTSSLCDAAGIADQFVAMASYAGLLGRQLSDERVDGTVEVLLRGIVDWRLLDR